MSLSGYPGEPPARLGGADCYLPAASGGERAAGPAHLRFRRRGADWAGEAGDPAGARRLLRQAGWLPARRRAWAQAALTAGTG